MRVLRHLTSASLAEGRRVVTFGDFDGVHLGHQRLLERLLERARQSDSEAAVLLFVSPAREVRQREGGLPLTDLRQRLTQLAAFGVPLVVLARPQREMRDSGDVGSVVVDLLGRLGTSRVVLGEVLEVGAARFRGADLSSALQKSTSPWSVDVLQGAAVEGRRVEGDTIRRALLQCDFASLQRLLGRPYSLAGRVVHGHHRGRQIGVPTVNLHLRGVQLPPDGVYAVRVRGEDLQRDLQGVANIGYKPTFGDPERTLEAHLLDFEGDLYGRRLAVRFAHRIRSERKFPDIQALVEQIRLDIEAVRGLLGSDG